MGQVVALWEPTYCPPGLISNSPEAIATEVKWYLEYLKEGLEPEKALKKAASKTSIFNSGTQILTQYGGNPG